MSDNAFKNDQPVVTTEPVVNNVPEISVPAEVADLIGPGKKYATLELALKSIPHSQKHISNLETETKQLRNELQVSQETLLNTVESGQRSTQAQPVIDPNSVAELVINKLEGKSEAQKKEANLKLASDTLVSKAGTLEAATKLIQDKANDLGLSFESMKELASKSPKAFLAYFDLTQPNTEGDTFSPPRSGNTATVVTNLNAGEPEQGTFAWYQKQRKVKGDQWYFSPSVTRERAATADKMGMDKFFGKR